MRLWRSGMRSLMNDGNSWERCFRDEWEISRWSLSVIVGSAVSAITTVWAFLRHAVNPSLGARRTRPCARRSQKSPYSIDRLYPTSFRVGTT